MTDGDPQRGRDLDWTESRFGEVGLNVIRDSGREFKYGVRRGLCVVTAEAGCQDPQITFHGGDAFYHA